METIARPEPIQKVSDDSTNADNFDKKRQEKPSKDDSKKSVTGNLGPFTFCTTFDYVLLITGVISAIVNGGMLPLFFLVFGNLYDEIGISGKEYDKYILLMVYLGIASFALCFLAAGALEMAAERQTVKAREKYFAAIMRQDIGWFDTSDSGELASKLNQNCVNIKDGLGVKLAQLFTFGALFIVGASISFWRSWKLTLVILCALPAMGVGAYFMMKAIASGTSMQEKAYSSAGSVAEESFSAIRTVVAFGLEDTLSERYADMLKKVLVQGLKTAVVSGISVGGTLGVMFFSYALGFWYSSNLVSHELEKPCCLWNALPDELQSLWVSNPAGAVAAYPDFPWGTLPPDFSSYYQQCEGKTCFTGGTALTVFFNVIIGAFVLGQAMPCVTAFVKASVSIGDLLTLVRTESRIDPSNPSGYKNVDLSGSVEFRKVHFSYPARPEKPIFAGLSLTIPAGKTVALVGGSGCGKSTIIQMIERYYDPEKGEILVDGRPLHEYNVQWIRSQMAIVGQEPKLFARSIRDNILMGRLEATEAEMVKAAENANALEFISSMQDDFNTHVGVGGEKLSGGQKQRVAIARAILRSPRILILDEATSALDNKSEEVVQKTLDRLIEEGKRTTIVIAHRLSTIRNADLIVVLDNADGTGAVVVEQGSHTDLMAKPDGLYRNLVKAQELGATKENRSVSLSVQSADMLKNAPDADERVRRESSQLSTLVTKYSMTPKVEVVKSEIKATESQEPTLAPVSYWRVMSYADKKYMFTGSLAAVVNGAVWPVYAVVLSKFIAVFFMTDADEIKEEASKWSLSFLGLGCAIFVAMVSQELSFSMAGGRLLNVLRNNLFTHVLHKEMAFFDNPQNNPGTISEILASDCLHVRKWCDANFAIAFQNISAIVIGLVISFLASWRVALVTLGVFAVMAPASTLEMKVMAHSNIADAVDKEGSAGFVMYEAISNVRTVVAFNLQKALTDEFMSIIGKAKKKGMWQAWLLGFLWGLSQFVQYAGQAVALWYGSRLVARGELELVDMNIAVFALIMAAMGMGQSAIFAADAAKAKAGASKIFNILDNPSRIDSRSLEGKLPSMEEDIQFSGVNFRYPTRVEVPIYNNISLTIPNGKTVALVGSSGCGKSTAIQLLQRLYDIGSDVDAMTGKTSGSITFGDVDIRDVNLSHLRSKMGLVSQEPVLFNVSIEENISYGKPGATQAEIEVAARNANAHDFILEQPDGYRTIVGKGGGRLSGGQKQRVAIARALLRNPTVLLLDEATSALDANSEAIVQEALDQVLKSFKRTTIVVAHRLSTIKNADKIIVLGNDGSGSVVAEEGTHEALIAKDGLYAQFVRAAQTV